MRLADWTLLLTNVPQQQMSVQEALVLARYRWQIELYWKRWKQEGILTEVFAKLVGLLITHWLTLIGCWQSPNRSMVKPNRW